MTEAEFTSYYPQFAGFQPAFVLSSCIAQANARFASFTAEDAAEARRLFTAHKLTLYARTALTDAGEALLLDACGSALVEQAADLAEAELRAAVPDAFLTDRFSPGYGDLPLALQDAVLRLLAL